VFKSSGWIIKYCLASCVEYYMTPISYSSLCIMGVFLSFSVVDSYLVESSGGTLCVSNCLCGSTEALVL